MKRPVIGITIDRNTAHPDRYESPSHYAKAVEVAGGLPLLLPYRTDPALIPQVLDVLDGVLLTGGDDMDPARYGEEWHPKAIRTDPDRTDFELALLAEIERRRTPTLGVCFGCQILNVHRGGSLIQFLPDRERPDALEHRKLNVDVRRHPVRIEPGTQLARVVGKSEISVNTRHKQAIKDLGRGLRVIATAPDGVIEGIEDPSLPLMLALQWHPENLHEEPEHLAPFRLLIEKARR